MKVIIITGSCGLIGSESVKFFTKKNFLVVGIDNNLRKYFFGKNGDTDWQLKKLKKIKNYVHYSCDIRNYKKLNNIFKKYQNKITSIIHCAAQPSHDWAAKEPLTDFGVNANGTLNLLELTRLFAKNSSFIFLSTNKVYGDTPNKFNYVEKSTRFEPLIKKISLKGFDEKMSIDNSKHSLFGASKVSADILVQEYGKYFNLKTVSFRGGCLTGPSHSGAELHGFLSYLVKCCLKNKLYKVYGYKGKQVRDNIHSSDLVHMIWEFIKKPSKGEVYNIGGGRTNSCSILEAIHIIEEITKKKMKIKFLKKTRIGDHIWYVTNLNKFKKKYPKWKMFYSLRKIILEIVREQSRKQDKK
jgi:CDP-paratose 2-epimerase